MPYDPKLKELLVTQYNDETIVDELTARVHQDDRPSFLVANYEHLESSYIQLIEKRLGIKAIASASDESIWLPFDGEDDIAAYARNRSGAYFIGLVGLAKKRAGLERIDDEQVVVVTSAAVASSFRSYNPSGLHQRILRLDRDHESPRPFAEYNIHLLSE